MKLQAFCMTAVTLRAVNAAVTRSSYSEGHHWVLGDREGNGKKIFNNYSINSVKRCMYCGKSFKIDVCEEVKKGK